MRYRIHLNAHMGRGKTLLRALAELMKQVDRHGSDAEIESIGRSMMDVTELGVRLDENWDMSTGVPEERN